MQNTVPRFVEVYSQIQKIKLEDKHMTNEIALHSNVQKLSTLNGMAMSIKNDLTDKELICGFVTKGLGKLIVMDSERYLSAANRQVRASIKCNIFTDTVYW